jgi:hypothetical protein
MVDIFVAAVRVGLSENEIIINREQKQARPLGRAFLLAATFGLVRGAMASYPVEVRRCQHIKTNGTQCGSPALRNEGFCYYHSQSRPERVEVCEKSAKPGGEILFPLLEDAHSIQAMVRQVAIMLLRGTIDSKKAGIVLYALQIAASNLKRMDEEKARPVQVVVDTEKVTETPLGMTPWSGKAAGHEIDEPADIAAERELWEVRDWWEQEYRKKKELIEERLKGIGQALGRNPPLESEGLYSELSHVRTMLEFAVSSMNDHLEMEMEGD